ncbi:hypothetical protein F4808DRAFT_101597 [Astrocystis sublimbata]|nr:hypothetical protein F4808DRAFT_101597 [Astrocystis sublimbata]
MRQYFPDTDTYIITPETPLGDEENLRRVDWALRRNVQFDNASEDILLVAYWELKRLREDTRKVDSQIENAGATCLREEGLDKIYLLTACSTLFRTFKMYPNPNDPTQYLREPMDDGPGRLTDIDHYHEIDDGVGSAIFKNFVAFYESDQPTTNRIGSTFPNAWNEGSFGSAEGDQTMMDSQTGTKLTPSYHSPLQWRPQI